MPKLPVALNLGALYGAWSVFPTEIMGEGQHAHVIADAPLIRDGLAGLCHLSAVGDCARGDDVDRVVEIVPEDDVEDVPRDCKQPRPCKSGGTFRALHGTAYAWDQHTQNG